MSWEDNSSSDGHFCDIYENDICNTLFTRNIHVGYTEPEPIDTIFYLFKINFNVNLTPTTMPPKYLVPY
jgi:hypothetical protein